MIRNLYDHCVRFSGNYGDNIKCSLVDNFVLIIS